MATAERLVFFTGTTFVWDITDAGLAASDTVWMNIKQEVEDEATLLETGTGSGEWVVISGKATLTLTPEQTEALAGVEAADYSVYVQSVSGVKRVLRYGEVFCYDHATLGAE